MEINVTYEELRKRKLMLCTPCYGGMTHSGFTSSFGKLVATCNKYGVVLKTYFLNNESLITRARAYCTDVFLRSDCTHMIFIDSDITFEPEDVIALLALQGDETEYDVIGAAYPKKNISWEKVKVAVDKGFADENPNELANFIGDYVFNPVSGKDIRITEPAEVQELGTGFMMIRRKTFETFAEHYGKDLTFKPDHVRSEDFNGDRELIMYFDTVIDPVTKRYLSEDYMFCQYVRKAGMRVWLCPWMKLEHTGTYTFGGSLQHIANIQAHPTADPEKLKKKK